MRDAVDADQDQRGAQRVGQRIDALAERGRELPLLRLQPRQQLRRQDELWKDGLTTRETLERAQNDVKVREAELKTREQDIETREQQIKQEQAALSTTRCSCALSTNAVVIMAAQVVARYVFNNPFVWAEEISTYLFIWIVFLGSGLAFQRRTHIALDYFVRRLPRRIFRWLHLALSLMVLAFLVLLVPQLVEWIRSPHKTYRLLAWFNMALILVSCWHLRILEISLVSVFNSAQDSIKFWIVLDEAANWALFAGLAYLLFATLPVWLKEIPRILLSKTGMLPQRSHEPSRPSIP